MSTKPIDPETRVGNSKVAIANRAKDAEAAKASQEPDGEAEAAAAAVAADPADETAPATPEDAQAQEAGDGDKTPDEVAQNGSPDEPQGGNEPEGWESAPTEQIVASSGTPELTVEEQRELLQVEDRVTVGPPAEGKAEWIIAKLNENAFRHPDENFVRLYSGRDGRTRISTLNSLWPIAKAESTDDES